MSDSILKSRLSACLAMLAALLVACGITLAVSPAYANDDLAAGLAAQEDGGEATAVTVALTVVDEEDDAVVYNGKVTGLTTENTVADLLSAAGYSQIDAYAGDPHTYVETYGSPYFLGKDYNSLTGFWWATIFNGSSNNYKDALLGSNLKNGGHYQYVYTNRVDPSTYETTFEYTTTIPDPLTTEVPNAIQLMNNLTARFAKGGEDGAINNYTYGAALALAYLGKGYLIDAESLAEEAAQVSYPGTLAKYVIALEVAGAHDAALEQIDRIDRTLEATTSFYDLVIIVPAYNVVGQALSGGKYATAVQAILANQREDGLFPNNEWAGPQEAAQAIFALAPYLNDDPAVEGLADALSKARTAAAAKIDPATGLIPSSWGLAADIDAMGELIDSVALYSKVKGDPVSGEVATMADALVTIADPTLDGFVATMGEDYETMAAADAFRGLAAAWRTGWNKMSLDNVVNVVDIADATIARIADQIFTGNEIKPALTVTFNGKELVKGADFDVAYTNNTNVGTATATVTGQGVYKGTNKIDFTINPAPIANATAAAIADAKYTGKAIEPAVSLSFGGKTLVAGTDFTVGYADNTKAGTATVTVTGKGNFTGTKALSFNIGKAKITKKMVSKIKAQKYKNGKAVKPKVTVKFKGVKLKKGVDYKVTYKKNKKPGTATAVIKGIGSFKGTVKAQFTIKK